MESIKRLFTAKKDESQFHSKERPEISPPVAGSLVKLTPGNSPPVPPQGPSLCRQYHTNHATTTFTPVDRGREETLAWLTKGTLESLKALLTSRDQHARQVRRGPKTKGTREVQLILKQPSRKTVEQLHGIKQQAELNILCGAIGIVYYNFSRSFGWNKASVTRVPSLQLQDLVTRMRGIKTVSMSLPAVLYTPIDWLVLPTPTAAQKPKPQPKISSGEHEEEEQEEPARCWSPEPGGWRDSRYTDITDMRADFTLNMSSKKGEVHFTTSEKDEEGEEAEDDVEADEEENSKGEYDPDDVDIVTVTPDGIEAMAIKINSGTQARDS